MFFNRRWYNRVHKSLLSCFFFSFFFFIIHSASTPKADIHLISLLFHNTMDIEATVVLFIKPKIGTHTHFFHTASNFRIEMTYNVLYFASGFGTTNYHAQVSLGVCMEKTSWFSTHISTNLSNQVITSAAVFESL